MTGPDAERGSKSTLRAQLSVTIFLMLLGVGMLIGGINYGFGSLSAPGSGFVPFLVGLALIGFGAVLLVQDLRGKGVAHSDLDVAEGHAVVDDPELEAPHHGADDGVEVATPESGSRFSGPISLLITIACFAFVLFATEAVGLLVTAAIIVGVLAFVMRTSWWASILLGAGFYGAGYMIFAIWLAIPLPFGTLTGG